MQNYKSGKFIPALTGVRAIAAYMVYLHHFQPALGGWQSSFGLIKEFHVGVGIFFVLSGFMIAHRYYEQVQFKREWLFNYVAARFARIYPMYFLTTCLVLISATEFSWREFWINVTLFRGFLNEEKFSGVAQGWSLTVEECFYFCAPLIFLSFRRRLAWLAMAAVPVLGWVLVKLHLFSGSTFMENVPFMMLYTFFGRFFEFFVGVTLALLVNRGFKSTGVGFPFLTWGGGLMALACIQAMSLLVPSRADMLAVRQLAAHGTGLFHPAGIILNNFILPVLIAAFFAGLITEKTGLSRLLGSRTFVLLGQSSYIFYLIHMCVIRDFIASEVTSNYLLIFLLINVISILLFKGIEEPLNKRLRALASAGFRRNVVPIRKATRRPARLKSA